MSDEDPFSRSVFGGEDSQDDRMGSGYDSDDFERSGSSEVSDYEVSDLGSESDSGPKYVTTYADTQRVGMGGTDNRFKTVEQKAEDRLKLVYETPHFSGMERDDILISKLTKKFGTRLPMLNLHTLLATAVWIQDSRSLSEKEKMKKMAVFCGTGQGGMGVDAADLLRYQKLITKTKPEIKI